MGGLAHSVVKLHIGGKLGFRLGILVRAAHVVDDPLAAAIAARLADAPSTEARVDAILAFDAVVPADLAGNAVFRAALIRWLAILEADGARAALAQL